MQKKLQALLFALLFVAALPAQELALSGELSTDWGVLAPGTESAGDFSLGTSSLELSLDAYSANSSLLVQGVLAYDVLSSSLDFDFTEAYIDYSDTFWGVRLGRQKVSWGKADGIAITNSVFPEDFTSLFLDDSTLAIDALRFSVYQDYFTLDAYWIPFFTGTALPLEEGNLLRKHIVPDTAGGLPVLVGGLESPDFSLANGEYALKLSGYFPLCDVSVYAFYGWDKMPLLDYSVNLTEEGQPTAITLGGSYERMAMLGMDAAFPLGETVLRFESAFFPNRLMQLSAEEILSGSSSGEKHNQLSCLVGFDWMPSGWTITAQYYFDYAFGDLAGLEDDRSFTHGATLSLSKTFLSETLEVAFSGMLGLNDFDSALVPQVVYSFTDSLKGELGAFVFLPGAEADGAYGAYKDLSTVYVSVGYSF